MTDNKQIPGRIDIITADPAGNKTVFVLTPVERQHYARVAEKILANDSLAAEQVAFVLPIDSSRHKEPVDGRFEMCGLEFCGNATRSFGLMAQLGLCNRNRALTRSSCDGILTIDAGGVSTPLKVTVDAARSTASLNMPLPALIEDVVLPMIPDVQCTLLSFEGITHIIVRSSEADRRLFDEIKDYYYEEHDPPCFGVMFCNEEKCSMTPVVFVRDVNSTYFENSCGSGSTAAACAFSKGKEDGRYTFDIRQPGGAILTTVEVQKGKPVSVSISGRISFSAIINMDIRD